MAIPESPAGALNLVGGRLCLDFTNTIDGRNGRERVEYLNSYADLVAWSCHTDITTEAQAQRLLDAGERDAAAAAAVLRCALTLREALYRIFSEAGRSAARARDLVAFNEALSAGMARARIVQTPEGFAWGWDRTGDALDQMLWPVVRSAAELLTSSDLARVRECPGKDSDCAWLFLDSSKNHSRRWCNMGSCGNRAKARRHYARRQHLA